ncbi:hypothetical protein CDD82_7791 [Ophiocordyceps australis]|uniref:Zn(2)-C6 fungal-type domain-containing protein n=1 Tax=Ophiocordyceps australis TaxID=1399860 RepID=A0A2C5YPD7_9HYPO|nr:hypothetical protein CDD82_7791 [Ophiocordyceps australis]
MVTTTCFPSTASRRYSSFRTPYLPSYVDRKVVEHRDPGCNMGTEREGSGSEDVSSQRKRIAVACGRCRKRKIRCSGDAGNGQPCTNCKTAGYEPCQFLRVSSQEVSQVKGTAFSYNLDASRIAQARGSSSVIAPLCVPVSPYADSLGGVGDSALPPRASAYSSKQYYQGWASGGGYADDSGVEYALCQPSSMQAVSEPSYLAGPYRITSSGSGPSSGSAASAGAAKTAGAGLVYMDTEAAYGYGSVSVGGDRQSEGPETGCLPYPSLTSAALPRSSGERLPASGLRTLPSPASHVGPNYRVDAMSDYRKGDSSASSSTAVLDMASGGYHGYDGAQHLSYAATHSMTALSRSTSVFAADGGLVHGAGSAMRASSGGGYRFADAAFNHGNQEPSQQHQQRQHHRHTDMASGPQALVFHKDSYGQENHGIGHGKSPARTRA